MRGVRELAELARDEVRRLLADVDRVVADPLEAAGDDDHAQPPLALSGVAAELEHVLDDAPVRSVDQLVEVDEALGPLDVALRRTSRARRGSSPRRGSHLVEALDQRLVRRQAVRELRQLGDRHAEVGHPLEVEVRVEHGEHEAAGRRRPASVARAATRCPARSRGTGVDLVVERDHLVGELGVALAQGVDRATNGAQHELALLLEGRLERVELLLERDPHRDQPNRPVT